MSACLRRHVNSGLSSRLPAGVARRAGAGGRGAVAPRRLAVPGGSCHDRSLRLEAEEVSVGGEPVRFGVAGEGAPVLLVHGLSGSRRWWAPTVPALAARFRVYTLDLPGFGSTRRSRRRALASAPAWLLGWMQAVGLPAAHVVGHSMGGYVALRLAAEAPAAVRRLVLVAPAGVPTGASLLGHAIPLAAAVRHLPLSFVPVLVRDALSAGPGTIWRAARDLLAEDARLLHLAQVAAPTLLIWGSRDSLTPVSAAPLLRTAIPDARLLVLDGAGHVPMYERTSELNAALFAFLSGRVVGE